MWNFSTSHASALQMVQCVSPFLCVQNIYTTAHYGPFLSSVYLAESGFCTPIHIFRTQCFSFPGASLTLTLARKMVSYFSMRTSLQHFLSFFLFRRFANHIRCADFLCYTLEALKMFQKKIFIFHSMLFYPVFSLSLSSDSRSLLASSRTLFFCSFFGAACAQFINDSMESARQ